MGLPSLQALVGRGGGASLLSSHIFHSGGGGFTTTCRGGGLNSRVWEGVLFCVAHVHFVNQI